MTAKKDDSLDLCSIKTFAKMSGVCSGQQFPDTELSFSSATAGGTKPLC